MLLSITPEHIRCSLTFLLSFAIVIVTMPIFIKKMIKTQATQALNTYLTEVGMHTGKTNIPTMGGLVILIATAMSTLVFSPITDRFVAITLLAGLCFGSIGLWDDMSKILKQNHRGITARIRIILGVIIAGSVVYAANSSVKTEFYSGTITLGKISLSIGIVLYTIIRIFAIIGTANAVNLTDGLDGLVSIPVAITTIFLGITAYTFAISSNHTSLLEASNIPCVCASIVGSLIGFLWFNAQPAKIFMGDTGSLGIGGMLGTIACLIKAEIPLFIAGGLFVIETMSVIIQVISFKMRKKRVFLMSPIHHHFEQLGWKEQNIVTRFWIISIVSAAIALMTI